MTPAQKGKGRGDQKTFYIILALLLVAGIGTLSYLATKRDLVTTVDPNLAPIANQGHVMGSASAPVEIVEFGDFECPACGSFANLTEPDIRSRLVSTGQVRFRFMDYPLDIHRNTWPAHLAAWCASEQNKFWEMHDVIFQNQDRWSGLTTSRPHSVLTPLAQRIGLNMDQYESCVESRKYYPQIKANYDEALKRGIPSTPTFIVGDQQINGAVSYDEFKKYVDRALASAPRTKADTGSGVKLSTPSEAPRPR